MRAGDSLPYRTLSPKSTALIAVSELPIEVPFHSIIGQNILAGRKVDRMEWSAIRAVISRAPLRNALSEVVTE